MDIILVAVSLAILGAITAANTFSIQRLYKLLAKNADLTARNSELLRKMSTTRWGIHD